MVLFSPFFLFQRISKEGIVYHTGKEDIFFLNDVATDILHMSQYNPSEKAIHYMLSYLYEEREGASRCLTELEAQGLIIPSKAESVDSDMIIDDIEKQREFPYFGRPLSVNIFVNSLCNLSCKFCFLEGFSSESHMEIHEWLDIVNCFLENDAFKFSIAGLEPLLTPDYTFSLLEHVRHHNRIGGFISNGTIPLSKENIEKMDRHQIVATFSMESIHPSIHDHMSSVSGSHAHCMNNIEALLVAHIPFSLQSYASRENASEIPELVEYCSQKGIPQFSMLNLMGGRWVEGEDFFDYALTPHEYRTLAERIQKKGMVVEYEHFNFEVMKNEYAYNFFTHCTCSAGKSSVTISPDGKVYPCPASLTEDTFCMGDAADIASLWKGKVVQLFRPERNQMKSESCRHCPIFIYCRGGCLMTANNVLGDLYAGDPRCPRVYEEYFGEGTPC